MSASRLHFFSNSIDVQNSTITKATPPSKVSIDCHRRSVSKIARGGYIFGSARCDCGNQLALAMQQIEEAGRGGLVYLRGHEGRAIGLGYVGDALPGLLKQLSFLKSNTHYSLTTHQATPKR
ncbi:hypothetical protein L1887_28912 [Cichorium endivia]|nr:hypothetical protein L1887_28912 [Cichorium endivia]